MTCAIRSALLLPLLAACALPQQPDPKQWALAASAILHQRNGDRHDLLGGREPTPGNGDYARRLLRGSWGVVRREDLDASMEWLRNSGQRSEFNRVGRTAAASIAAPPDGRRRFEIARSYYPKFGAQSILAWDYMRYISLCRWGYLGGFLSEQEAWDRILPAAQHLQQTFSSWQEMGRNFLIGREFWSPGDEDTARTEYAYLTLLWQPQSPWRRIPWDLDLGPGAPPPVSGETSATLELTARPRGLTCVLLNVMNRPRPGSLVAPIEQALGCKVRVLDDKAYGQDYRLYAECGPNRRAPQRDVEVQYRLEPLAAALRAQNVTLLFTMTSHSAVGASAIVPPEDKQWVRDGYRYYLQTYDLADRLPAPTLKYGFAPEQVFHLLLFSAAFLALTQLLAFVRRRNALNSAFPADRRWTRFELVESLQPFLVWLCWPVIVASEQGFSFLRLWLGGEEFTGAAIAVAVALIPPMAAQLASAAILAPVYQRLRGIEATRGQLVLAAFWRNAAWVAPLTLTLLLSDPLHTLNPGTLLVLFSAFQLAGILLHRQLFASTGALGLRVEAGPLKDRILALAEAAKTKVRRIYLIPDNGWKRADAYSVGDGSIAVCSSVLDQLNRREVDAILAHDIAWLASSTDRKLMARHVLGMFAVFLYAWWAAWSMKPEGVEVLIGLGLLGLNGSLARLYQRQLAKTDQKAAVLAADPEALITGLAKLERANLHVIDSALKKRLKSIAKAAGIEEEKLAALIGQTTNSGDRYPAPAVKYGEMTVVC